MKDFEFKD